MNNQIINKIGLYPEQEKLFKEYAGNIFKSGMLSDGNYTRKFEDFFTDILFDNKCIAVNSGTAALYLTLYMLRHNYYCDEVLVPRYTVPMVIDMCENVMAPGKTICIASDNDMLMEIHSTKRIVENSPCQHPIILFVLTAGIINQKLAQMRKIAKDNGAILIVDASHAHGCKYKGKTIEHYADIVIYSMYATKVLTCGEGGVIVLTKNLENKILEDLDHVSDLLKLYRNQCNSKGNAIENYGLGNFRISEFSAACGYVDITFYKQIINHRRKIASIYKNNGIKSIQDECNDGYSSYYKYTVRVDNKDNIKFELSNKRIFCPGDIYKKENFRNHIKAMLDQTEKNLINGHVNLPLDRFITEKQAEKVSEVFFSI